MQRLHPNRRKAQLRRTLADDLVLTTVQLERRGLLRAADGLALPRVTYTCRTRVNDAGSDLELTFIGKDTASLRAAPRELMHLAGLAEARSRLTLTPGEQWRHVSLSGRTREQHPDAEIVQTLDLTHASDAAVEFDAGYDLKRVERKLCAFAEHGYSRLLWATTIHSRVRAVINLAQRLQAGGKLPHVTRVETYYVNFWRTRNPYDGRPRCHKPFTLHQSYGAAAGSAGRSSG
ncbi:hypothetical protein ACFP9V_03985 [Deinococcus radiopugnans]|uniref:Uncharacterized protein n=1 Tax=Deinococcus radiopugnans ATCC 19172 TaxID=585398 RepID=A0A5C4Y7Q5_9DEIO|nr:hypothetical protein [Deinococcus radiopugnans]MBB6016918.1 hypothetical protein [Deinococcus radiopugnans ATCC 19172]TNM71471.1 hypothetical protein FHR04_07940 [Deinococcus radiopugnans ATCC 19172]